MGNIDKLLTDTEKLLLNVRYKSILYCHYSILQLEKYANVVDVNINVYLS